MKQPWLAAVSPLKPGWVQAAVGQEKQKASTEEGNKSRQIQLSPALSFARSHPSYVHQADWTVEH